MTQNLLELHLREYDGQAISLLSEARMACKDRTGYLGDLVALCFDPSPTISDGATWILKAELEDGAEMSPELCEQVVASLGALEAWQAVLHICQAADGFPFSAPQAGGFIRWATTFSDHPRPFLRAWSMNSIVVLGRKFEEFRRGGERALAKAENDTAASVRARARRLRHDTR